MLTLIQTQRAGLAYKQTGGTMPSGQPASEFNGLLGYRRTLQALAKIPPLAEVIAKALEHPFLRAFSTQDSILAPPTEADQFVHRARAVEATLGMLADLLTGVVEQESESTFAVQIPHTEDATQLAGDVQRVAEFFAGFTGFHYGEGDEQIGAIALTGFDIGSEWLVFSAAAPGILVIIGLVLDAARNLIDWGLLKAAELKALESLNEDTKSAVEQAKKLRRLQTRALAERIKDKTKSSADNEELNRLAVVIGSCADLVERRFIFQASRKALPEAREAFSPEAVQKAFAEKLLTAGVSSLKLLGEGDQEGKALGGDPEPKP